MSQTSTTTAEGTGEAPAAETGHTEGTEAQGGSGGHFPPLDAATFPSQLFWLVIFFGLLYVLMSKLALPKLARILEGRAATIEGDLAKAQSLKEQTEAAVKAYEKSLADARAKANGIAQETRDGLAKEVESERAALEAELGKKMAAAEATIAKNRAKAMEKVEDLASEAAAEIVAQLTGAKVTKAAVAKAIKG